MYFRRSKGPSPPFRGGVWEVGNFQKQDTVDVNELFSVIFLLSFRSPSVTHQPSQELRVEVGVRPACRADGSERGSEVKKPIKA